MRNFQLALSLLLFALSGSLARAEAPALSRAGPPQNKILSIYDTGFALVSEMRRLTPARGANEIEFRDLPTGLDPTHISFVPQDESGNLEVHQQRYRDDSFSSERLLKRYLGRAIEVHTTSGNRHRGTLLNAHGLQQQDDQAGFVLLQTDNAGHLFLNAYEIEQIVLPDVARHAYLTPSLIWHAQSGVEGPQNVRLSYRLDAIEWQAAYDVVMAEAGDTAYFNARIGLHNQSTAHLRDAQVRLISTARGQVRDQQRANMVAQRDPRVTVPLRYAYGATEPTFEEAVAGLAPVATYPLPRSVSLAPGDQQFLQYASVQALPVERFYVYDGVRFDRFQRFRRNDWNYGTETHETVEALLQFDNAEIYGLGLALPPGRFRLYERRRDGTIELVGEDQLLTTAADEAGHVRLGPARGLRGHRERTSYTEVTPLRVYEESFRIELENNTEDTVEIRVVEHLYRWHDFEIVRSDAEFEETAPQTIEFRPTLRPGGRRTIHYTVRYTW